VRILKATTIITQNLSRAQIPIHAKRFRSLREQQISPSSENHDIHPAALDDDVLLADCTTERTRRGGPGGQHRNKTESAIVLIHQPTGVSGQAGERRSQHDNRREALSRLKLNLALAIRIAKPIDDESATANDLWLRKLDGSRMKVGTGNDNFPALLAEALDWVYAAQFEFARAAGPLGLSTSQLVKFLKQHAPAWQMVQQQRHKHGLPRLK